MPLRNVIYILWLVLTTTVSVWIAFFALNSSEAIHVVKNYGYWVMLTNCGVVLYLLRKCVSHSTLSTKWIRAGVFRYKWPVLFILAATLITQLLQPHGYKITMDEPVLGATAQRMHEYKEVMTTARTHEINGVYRQLDGFVDKRPFFYPFLVSILHDVTGYRASNPILLNAGLTLILLVLIYITGAHFWPGYGGYLSILLFLTVPLLSMSATGAGFGILNLVMILTVIHAALVYLRAPEIHSMNVLVYLGLLLAQTRYESALFILPITVVILLGWKKRNEILLSCATVCAPLLMIPYGLQRVIFDSSPLSYELRDGATDAFSLSYIPSNLIDAADYFFNLSIQTYPNSALLSGAFCVGVLLLLVSIVLRRMRIDFSHSDVWVWLSFAAVIVFNFFLLMAYHWGQLNDIMATRIALPFMVLQVLVCVFVLRRLLINRIAITGFVACCIVYFVGFTIPSTAQNDYLQWVPGHHEAMWIQKQSARLRGENALVISKMHLMSIVERIPAIEESWARANLAKVQLHYELQTYDNIYVMHTMVADPNSDTGMVPATRVYEDYDLELVAEEKLGERRFIRMSRVVGVHAGASYDALIQSLKRVPVTDHEKLAFIAETLP
ncbi:MAG TPA: hypothetical protein DCX06_04555 [Opitutae bacterium]|nr:hypothetical protein [Opitutae bacterium]